MNNVSGYIGVTYDPRRFLWKSYIGGGSVGKQIFLGRYTDMKDAVISTIKAEIKYYGIYRSNTNELKFKEEYGDYNFYE